MERVPLLLDEPPIVVSPTLAKLIGINHAIVLQQLHFLLNITQKAKNRYNFVDGKWYVYNTIVQWQSEYFVWLSKRTVQQVFIDLETDGFISSIQSVKHKSDRTKWYTIDYEAWREYCTTMTQKLRVDNHDAKVALSNEQDSNDGLSETTTETTTETIGARATIPQIIEAWLKAQDGYTPRKPYENKTNRESAQTILDAGFTPEHVAMYIAAKLPTWRGDSIPLTYIAANIGVWAKANPVTVQPQGAQIHAIDSWHTCNGELVQVLSFVGGYYIVRSQAGVTRSAKGDELTPVAAPPTKAIDEPATQAEMRAKVAELMQRSNIKVHKSEEY